MKNNKIKKILIGILIFACIFVAVGIPITYFNGALFTCHPLNTPKDGQIRVACVGDSITYGHAVSNWPKNNYPAQLGSMLGDNYCVNNYGYSNRTAQFGADYPYTDEKLYQQSLSYNPDIVILMLGTNDTKAKNWKGVESFKKDYSQIIDSYLNLSSKPTVYLLLPVPIYKAVDHLDNNVLVNEMIPVIKEIASEKNLSTIDMYNTFLNKEDLFSDGVHPNKNGAKLFAETVYNVLIEN